MRISDWNLNSLPLATLPLLPVPCRTDRFRPRLWIRVRGRCLVAHALRCQIREAGDTRCPIRNIPNGRRSRVCSPVLSHFVFEVVC